MDQNSRSIAHRPRISKLQSVARLSINKFYWNTATSIHLLWQTWKVADATESVWSTSQRRLLSGPLWNLPTPDIHAIFLNKITTKLNWAIHKGIKYIATKSTQRELRWSGVDARARAGWGGHYAVKCSTLELYPPPKVWGGHYEWGLGEQPKQIKTLCVQSGLQGPK